MSDTPYNTTSGWMGAHTGTADILKPGIPRVLSLRKENALMCVQLSAHPAADDTCVDVDTEVKP